MIGTTFLYQNILLQGKKLMAPILPATWCTGLGFALPHKQVDKLNVEKDDARNKLQEEIDAH
jgi:hypothetical protein